MSYYQVTERDGRRIISIVLSDGYVAALPDSDPNFRPLLQAALNKADEETLRRLSVPGAAIASVVALSDRMDMRDGKIYFDGEKVKGRIAKHLRRMFREEDPKLSALVGFLTKLKSNPSEESQKALYRWLSDRNFTITEDGDIIGYKGLTATGLSIHSGHAWVNGVRVDGQIPNPIGATITMERDAVDPNRFAHCSYGLHVGTWGYASSFGNGMTVTVQVDPADVVMVPDDCGGQKMRVCRYKVLSSAIQEFKLPVYHDPDADLLHYGDDDELDDFDENDEYDPENR